MKKRAVISAVCILVLLLIVGGMWYTRPMTFTQLLPELDRSKTGGLTAMYTIPETNSDGRVDIFIDTINLQGDDPAIQRLFLILDSQTYHRSLTSPLLRFRSVISIKSPDWTIVLHGGYSLNLSIGTGKLYVRYTDDDGTHSFNCTVEDQEQFEQAVTELLAANTPKE